jgi:thiamine pyrophosphate-dependent acetolactate synthase large subunit-like protein
MLHSVNTKLINMKTGLTVARAINHNINTLDRHVQLSSKSIKKMNIGEYIVASLIDKNIDIGFSYNKQRHYSPIFNIINKQDEFNIIFAEIEKICAKMALTYVMNNSNVGVMFNTSRYGFSNICGTLELAKKNMYPMLLLSFFNSETELKLSQFPGGSTKMFVKESTTIKTSNQFPLIFEEALSYSTIFPAGPIHLNISNDILYNDVDFDDTNAKDIQNLPILQYLEKLHLLLEEPQKSSSLMTIPARQQDKRLSDMYKFNFYKQRKP